MITDRVLESTYFSSFLVLKSFNAENAWSTVAVTFFSVMAVEPEQPAKERASSSASTRESNFFMAMFLSNCL